MVFLFGDGAFSPGDSTANKTMGGDFFVSENDRP